ncbi:uncharacterized protein SETTUDRAFT_21387 [Exserohilum turcica Et28A]|uniref:Uncharacterized protein n=1 Tax=Exserohilum turcicum (strain 28A) TaxID=671987 RepID=R0K388_EXST2|nr:uncharacterized protein SETTUDRAFT_21387 [Exserohilum turcica Et28A]EOA84049.1 hypothetical protein SETTUDRAFT_21387 [Exserohilum turcica Et28A]
MGDLAVQFNAATPTNVDGVMVNAIASNSLSVRVGTEERLPGTYTLLISGNGTCNPSSSSSLCKMQPGLISSTQKTLVNGKMVYELVDPSKPSSESQAAAELSTDYLPLLDGSKQLLINTTDGQPQDTATLVAEPFATEHTVASNVYKASTQRGLGRMGFNLATRTMVARARKSREPRPRKPVRNITLNFGNRTQSEGSSEILHTTSLIWAFAALTIFHVV